MVNLNVCTDGCFLFISLELLHKSTNLDAGYPDRLGPSGKHFLTVLALHVFMA